MIHDRPVLVTGANGFIGSHLVDELLHRGYRVRAMARRGSDLSFVDRRAEVVQADVRDPLSLPPAVTGTEAVFHAAGIIGTFRVEEFRAVNEEGARNLALACAKAAPGLRRFVLVSSLAASGPSRDGRPVRETDPPRPVSEYGRSKLLGERAVFAAAGRIPVTIVRPPVVYGPRDRGVLTLFRLLCLGLEPRFPGVKLYSVCHVRDLVRGIVDASESESTRGRVYHLAEAKAWTAAAFIGEIAKAVGGVPRGLPIPDFLLRLLAPLVDALQRETGRRIRPVTDKAREVLATYWIADATAARRDFGFLTRVTLPAGVRETAEFYRSAGWIRGSA